jgi:hypothetical protein
LTFPEKCVIFINEEGDIFLGRISWPVSSRFLPTSIVFLWLLRTFLTSTASFLTFLSFVLFGDFSSGFYRIYDNIQCFQLVMVRRDRTIQKPHQRLEKARFFFPQQIVQNVFFVPGDIKKTVLFLPKTYKTYILYKAFLLI